MKHKTVISLFFVLILCHLIVPNSVAELKEFRQEIEIAIEKNTLFVKGDNVDYERDLTIGNNDTINDFDKDLAWSWVENVSCSITVNLEKVETSLDNLSANVNQILYDSLPYYDLYADCYANKTVLSAYKVQNEQYMDKYDACSQNLPMVQANLQYKKDQLRLHNETLNQTKLQLSNANGWKWIFIIVGTVALILTINLYRKKWLPFSRGGQNPSTKDSRTMNPK